MRKYRKTSVVALGITAAFGLSACASGVGAVEISTRDVDHQHTITGTQLVDSQNSPQSHTQVLEFSLAEVLVGAWRVETEWGSQYFVLNADGTAPSGYGDAVWYIDDTGRFQAYYVEDGFPRFGWGIGDVDLSDIVVINHNELQFVRLIHGEREDGSFGSWEVFETWSRVNDLPQQEPIDAAPQQSQNTNPNTDITAACIADISSAMSVFGRFPNGNLDIRNAYFIFGPSITAVASEINAFHNTLDQLRIGQLMGLIDRDRPLTSQTRYEAVRQYCEIINVVRDEWPPRQSNPIPTSRNLESYLVSQGIFDASSQRSQIDSVFLGVWIETGSSMGTPGGGITVGPEAFQERGFNRFLIINEDGTGSREYRDFDRSFLGSRSGRWIQGTGSSRPGSDSSIFWRPADSYWVDGAGRSCKSEELDFSEHRGTLSETVRCEKLTHRTTWERVGSVGSDRDILVRDIQGNTASDGSLRATAALILRVNPGSWNSRILTIPDGTTVGVPLDWDYTFDANCQGAPWAQVRHNGQTGWVCSFWLE